MLEENYNFGGFILLHPPFLVKLGWFVALSLAYYTSQYELIILQVLAQVSFKSVCMHMIKIILFDCMTSGWHLKTLEFQ